MYFSEEAERAVEIAKEQGQIVDLITEQTQEIVTINERIIRDINQQYDAFRATLAKAVQEAPDYMKEKFDYIEENGLSNGFAYTAYISSDEQIEIIKMHLEDKPVDELILKQFKDGLGNFKDRFLDRLEYGKELAELHINNIFNGSPLLSLHYFVSQVEELLKCYHGVPSTNEMENKETRKQLKKSSTESKERLIETINSKFHSVELVKKSYDIVLIDGFYKYINKGTKPENLPYLNRHDVMHVYSDTDRYNLLDIYKLLLLILSLLDLLELMDLLNQNEK